MSGTFRKRRCRGNAMVEVALLAPWIFFLFIGVLDFGFYSYALICTQNAARSAALANASQGGANSTSACTIVMNEMNSLPNRSLLTSCIVGTCPSTTGSVTKTQPLAVTACAVAGPDGGQAVHVIVSYFSIPMIPIPGVLTGQLTMTRTVEMPVLNLTPTS